jgi:hypothetical protein
VLRVTLEIPTDRLIPLNLVPAGFFRKFEELELLETLGLQRGWRLQVLRLRSRTEVDPAASWMRRLRRIRATYGLERLEWLESRPRTRDHFFLVRQRNPGPLASLWALATEGRVLPAQPFILREDRTVASFLADPRTVRRILSELKRLRVPYRLTGVHPSSRTTAQREPGPTPLLTPLQDRLLRDAYRQGFYAIPRRVSLSRLARSLGRTPTGLGKVLRRAEAALLRYYLEERLPPWGPSSAMEGRSASGTRRPRNSGVSASE